ncbi:MAG: hypothetical protein HFF50_03625 [Lawsonibacter sp.]|nr:hypothetical protein [Lawsonibacter sp.]
MKYEETVFKRTELAYIASYLMTGADPGPLGLTQEDSIQELEKELTQCLAKLDPVRQEELQCLINALASDYQQVGFCCGCRAGARLLGTLTG